MIDPLTGDYTLEEKIRRLKEKLNTRIEDDPYYENMKLELERSVKDSKDGSFDEYRQSLDKESLRKMPVPPQLPSLYIKNIDEGEELYQMGAKELEVHQRLLTPPDQVETLSNPQGAGSFRSKSTLKAKPLLSRKMKRMLHRSDHHVDDESLERMNIHPVVVKNKAQPSRVRPVPNKGTEYTVLPPRVI